MAVSMRPREWPLCTTASEIGLAHARRTGGGEGYHAVAEAEGRLGNVRMHACMHACMRA